MIAKEQDIEKINRSNFRSSLEALARPGLEKPLTPLFGSGVMAMASVLLYAEVSYFADEHLDFELIRAICGSRAVAPGEADYLFFVGPQPAHLLLAKIGTGENPEEGATMLFATDGLSCTSVRLSGPGIPGKREGRLPVTADFLKQLVEINSCFPQGLDLFFISPDNMLLGLPRTTMIEVLS